MINARLLLVILIFSSQFSDAQTWTWARASGGGGHVSQKNFGNVSDAIGNVYVTGSFDTPSIIFGSDTLWNKGRDDIFLAKFDSSGNVLWARSVSGNLYEIGYGVAVDSRFNVYLTGFITSDTVIFDSDTLTSDIDGNFFLAKYDSTGQIVWARSGRGNVANGTNAVTTDITGNVYVTGWFGDTLYLDSDTLGTNTLNNIFLAKYDSAGNVQWARSAGNNHFQNISLSVATDRHSNIYIAGYYNSFYNFIFGTDTLVKNNGSNVFLTKYDSNGNVLWAKGSGGIGSESGTSVALDGTGNAYLTGFFGSPVYYFGGDSLLNRGGYDIFLLKYDESGNELWGKSVSGNGHDFSYGVAIDSSGNGYIVGGFGSPAPLDTVSFGSLTILPPPNAFAPLFVIQFDPGGNAICYSSLSGGGYISTITANSSGQVYVSGSFQVNPLIVGSDTLALSADLNVFVARFNPNLLNVGISSLFSEEIFRVYPNPFHDRLSIVLSENRNEKTLLKLFDVLGQMKEEKEIFSTQQEFDFSNLPQGIYFLSVEKSNSVTFTKKIVKM